LYVEAYILAFDVSLYRAFHQAIPILLAERLASRCYSVVEKICYGYGRDVS